MLDIWKVAEKDAQTISDPSAVPEPKRHARSKPMLSIAGNTRDDKILKHQISALGMLSTSKRAAAVESDLATDIKIGPAMANKLRQMVGTLGDVAGKLDKIRNAVAHAGLMPPATGAGAATANATVAVNATATAQIGVRTNWTLAPSNATSAPTNASAAPTTLAPTRPPTLAPTTEPPVEIRPALYPTSFGLATAKGPRPTYPPTRSPTNATAAPTASPTMLDAESVYMLLDGDIAQFSIKDNDEARIVLATLMNAPPESVFVQPLPGSLILDIKIDEKGVNGTAARSQLIEEFNTGALTSFNGHSVLYVGLDMPTRTPTRAPTTPVPSAEPTIAPSRGPTHNPTQPPTLRPTDTPTFAPSLAPSDSPTLPPSLAPSDSPTLAPTNADGTAGEPCTTKGVGITSANASSASLVNHSTVVVVAAELPLNSSAPTLSPSLFPSIVPTLSPTLVPTKTPSDTPTAPPTISPSLTPSTRRPTYAPSDNFTRPTPVPCSPWTPTTTNRSLARTSASNTTAGGGGGAAMRAVDVVVVGTLMPCPAAQSLVPSLVPTRAPSDVPSEAPSRSPSLVPSMVPTRTPTEFPTTINPTPRPSAFPTYVPSPTPSNATAPPTFLPSAHPTRTPSNATASPTNATTTPTHLTAVPSGVPSARPTHTPSNATASPSGVPSARPTHTPSNATAVPSVQPSHIPSWVPTRSPTIYISDTLYIELAAAAEQFGMDEVTIARQQLGSRLGLSEHGLLIATFPGSVVLEVEIDEPGINGTELKETLISQYASGAFTTLANATVIYVGGSRPATGAPSRSPSLATATPSNATSQPSFVPTRAPSNATFPPTVLMTAVPTFQLTAFPTFANTSAPSASPTAAPTEAPTMIETIFAVLLRPLEGGAGAAGGNGTAVGALVPPKRMALTGIDPTTIRFKLAAHLNIPPAHLDLLLYSFGQIKAVLKIEILDANAAVLGMQLRSEFSTGELQALFPVPVVSLDVTLPSGAPTLASPAPSAVPSTLAPTTAAPSTSAPSVFARDTFFVVLATPSDHFPAADISALRAQLAQIMGAPESALIIDPLAAIAGEGMYRQDVEVEISQPGLNGTTIADSLILRHQAGMLPTLANFMLLYAGHSRPTVAPSVFVAPPTPAPSAFSVKSVYIVLAGSSDAFGETGVVTARAGLAVAMGVPETAVILGLLSRSGSIILQATINQKGVDGTSVVSSLVAKFNTGLFATLAGLPVVFVGYTKPTSAPSFVPSPAPSVLPSAPPSAVPTPQPSAAPSVQPTVASTLPQPTNVVVGATGGEVAHAHAMTLAPGFITNAPDQADEPRWAIYPGENIPKPYALPENGDRPLIHVYVINHSDEPLHFQFRHKLYNRIPPKFVAREATYEGELWNIVDTQGKIFKSFTAFEGNQLIQIY